MKFPLTTKNYQDFCTDFSMSKLLFRGSFDHQLPASTTTPPSPNTQLIVIHIFRWLLNITEPKNQLLDTYCLYIGVELKSSLSLKAMCKL